MKIEVERLIGLGLLDSGLSSGLHERSLKMESLLSMCIDVGQFLIGANVEIRVGELTRVRIVIVGVED